MGVQHSKILFPSLAFLALSACTNILGNKEQVKDVQPRSGPGNSAGFQISKALKSNADPASLLDIVGDEGTAFNSLCTTRNGTAGTGESSCQCRFHVDLGSGAQTFEVPTVYMEDNLVRCRYDIVQAGANRIEVSVHSLETGLVSNRLTLGVSNNLDALDLTDPNSYLRVKRYQCNEYLFIPNMFGGTGKDAVYDPFQSEHTVHQFPRNYYTTNMAASVAALIRESNSKPLFFSRWDCSFNPYNRPYWYTPEIYSSRALGGSAVISPHSGSGFNRELFYLARKPSGVFNVPVNAFHAPYVKTYAATKEDGSFQEGVDPPLGYGVRPQGGLCPEDQVEIPDGWHWVKVWSMRHGSSHSRKYLFRSGEIDLTGAIYCDPGLYPNPAEAGGQTYRYPVFPDCRPKNAAKDAPTVNPITSISNTRTDLASRVVGANEAARVCVNLPLARAGQSNNFDGADIWQRVGGADIDPLNMPWELGAFGPGTISTPLDRNSLRFIYEDLPEDANQSPWDYLFVVSPPSVTLTQMRNAAITNQNGPYVPMTFRRKEQCLGGNPISPNGDDCKFPRVYELRTGEVAVTDGATSEGAFPVCTIAPSDGVPR